MLKSVFLLLGTLTLNCRIILFFSCFFLTIPRLANRKSSQLELTLRASESQDFSLKTDYVSFPLRSRLKSLSRASDLFSYSNSLNPAFVRSKPGTVLAFMPSRVLHRAHILSADPRHVLHLSMALAPSDCIISDYKFMEEGANNEETKKNLEHSLATDLPYIGAPIT